MKACGRLRYDAGPRIWASLILSLAAILPAHTAETVSPADKVAWFHTNAIEIRSINPKEKDYSDLQAIRQAIGDARIVLLGGSNEEGIDKTRYRLVRFLHEEMGFDVFLFHEPLFDVAEFDRALDEGRMPRPDLEVSIGGGFWYTTYPNRTSDRIDILEYVRETHRTPHPLHAAGYSSWVSPYMVTEYCKHLFQYIGRVDPKLASSADRRAVQAMIELAGPGPIELTGQLPLGHDFEDLHKWNRALPSGLQAAARLYDNLGKLPASRPDAIETAFYRQTLELLAHQAAYLAQRQLTQQPVDPVLFTAQVLRPRSKIVVWANNWTAGRDLPLPEGPAGRMARATPASIGNPLAQALGTGAYAIAFSEIKNENSVLETLQAGPQPKLVPVEGDLESLLHAAGKPYSFVDFRALPAGHWLRQPLAARFIDASETLIWPDHYDGLVTIDLPARERKP